MSRSLYFREECHVEAGDQHIGFTMPPTKGKQATKGQKMILEENKKTLNFYLTIIGVVNTLYIFVQYVFFWDQFTAGPITMFILAVITHIGGYKFMGSIDKQKLDLNPDSGMAEHAKDLLILTAIVQTLSLISNYFWILWLVGPGWAFYLLWVNILGPWFFAEQPEVDEKKQRKMERKMKKHF